MTRRAWIFALAAALGVLSLSTDASACCHRRLRRRHCGQPACAAPDAAYGGSCSTPPADGAVGYAYAPVRLALPEQPGDLSGQPN